MKLEISYGNKTAIEPGVKLEAVRLFKDRGVTVAQAAQDLDVHENSLRKRVKEVAADPQDVFPGKGVVKP